MPVSKLDTAVRRVAIDNHITASEAKTLIKEVKASGSKKPIDDLFKAIDRTDAAIDTDATRLILKELDQKMSKTEWVHYAQKAASTAGAWGPGGEGSTKVTRANLPPALQKIFDKWEKSSPEDKPEVSSFDVAGKKAYLMSQYSEFGTSYGLFDEGGKSIELKEDSANVQKNARRIQKAYDQYFRAPDMKNWKNSIEHTELGVIRNYYANASELKGAPLTNALNAEMKKVISEDKKSVKKADVETQVFKNKTDGSFLIITGSRSGIGPEHFALFNKAGSLQKRFDLDI
ncbi:MAG: hypothetical protein U0228_04225 [Myxococcaceae bacterium]